MKEVNLILGELGISKVRLAKYLGVSRQMLYNYLSLESIDKWPKEKSAKLLSLLNVERVEEINSLKVNGEYIIEVENRLNEGVKSQSPKEVFDGIKGFNKKEQEILTDIITLLKDKMTNDPKNSYSLFNYLYIFLKNIESHQELKYTLGYITKALGIVDPNEFIFNKDKQYIFEAIIFSAMQIYSGGNASKTKLTKIHEDFEKEITSQKEERLSRTQELNANKIQALKELGYTTINEDNAKEVLDKIAEIESRKV